jgi:hypothetical protein
MRWGLQIECQCDQTSEALRVTPRTILGDRALDDELHLMCRVLGELCFRQSGTPLLFSVALQRSESRDWKELIDTLTVLFRPGSPKNLLVAAAMSRKASLMESGASSAPPDAPPPGLPPGFGRGPRAGPRSAVGARTVASGSGNSDSGVVAASSSAMPTHATLADVIVEETD